MKLAISVAIIIALCSPALADGECSIDTASDALMFAQKQVEADSDTTLTLYSGEEKDLLVAEINKEPPASTFIADKVLELKHPNDHYAIGLIEGECLTHIWSVPIPAWEAVRRRALGERG